MLLLILLCTGYGVVSGSQVGEVRCIERERLALLNFKQGLIDRNGDLSSWGGQEHNCCTWKGVSCNNNTSNVIGLQLPGYQLQGNISPSLLDLSTSLVSVDLSDNQLDGLIPDAFGSFVFLEYLDLSGNRLEGGIPESFSNLSSLYMLDLSHNQLTGLMPQSSFGQLTNLEIFDVSYNFLQGTVSESYFLSHHRLKVLDLSFSSLVFNLTTDWIPPFRLDILKLASCYLGPQFPKWLQTQSNLSELDLSSTGISGQVPEWLWDLSPRLQYLNLSHNQFSGRVPDLLVSSKLSTHPVIIDISYNNFSGFLPLFHWESAVLQLSNNMFQGSLSSICSIDYGGGLLDLSYNRLSGPLPNCSSMEKIAVLNLENNQIYGEIPHSLGQSECWLQILLLRNNNLSGELPPNLKNCYILAVLDVGGNQLTGHIPAYLGSNLPYLQVLSLRHNEFFGTIPPEVCYLTGIQVLDLSGNNISGRIPRCFNNFTSLVQSKLPNSTTMDTFRAYPLHQYSSDVLSALVYWRGKEEEYNNTLGFLKLIDLSDNGFVGNIPKEFSLLRGLISLNLSRNHLSGNIDSGIGQMEMLESLDLSRNHISGEIPIGMAELNYLAVLDLSNNNLSGSIPSGTQLQGFNASAYAGNNGLCGPPLAACHAADGRRTSQATDGDHVGKEDNIFDKGYYISVVVGFVVGFLGVIVILVLNKSWRRAYFGFWNNIWDLAVYVTINSSTMYGRRLKWAMRLYN
ncbi:UNVERIFIED_CONTAM: Receptor-like protein EIX1 [Sesamum radiatum]|uniref:Receptor-like protein EIX1 n=1 Tax=Sesamum radiatum TaxID=300843 RepID=A0AAW2PXD8_SESRA